MPTPAPITGADEAAWLRVISERNTPGAAGRWAQLGQVAPPICTRRSPLSYRAVRMTGRWPQAHSLASRAPSGVEKKPGDLRHRSGGLAISHGWKGRGRAHPPRLGAKTLPPGGEQLQPRARGRPFNIRSWTIDLLEQKQAKDDGASVAGSQEGASQPSTTMAVVVAEPQACACLGGGSGAAQTQQRRSNTALGIGRSVLGLGAADGFGGPSVAAPLVVCESEPRAPTSKRRIPIWPSLIRSALGLQARRPPQLPA